MSFIVKRTTNKDTLAIYGEHNKYALHNSGVLWIQKKEFRKDWKKEAIEANDVYKKALEIFGPEDGLGISCNYIENVFERGDRGYYDGMVFLFEIDINQIKRFLSVLGKSEKEIENLFNPKTHKKSIIVNRVVWEGKKPVINLIKRYQPNKYEEEYNSITHIAHKGLTESPKEDYDDYLWMGKDISWIEENPEQVTTPYNQSCHKINGIPHTCWRPW